MNCIYISGLEMPEGFAERGFVIRGDGRVRTFAGAVFDNAIAIPVPPHGRLIDADKLILFAKDKARQIADEEAYPPRSIAVSGLSVEDVINAPTIIPADVADNGV